MGSRSTVRRRPVPRGRRRPGDPGGLPRGDVQAGAVLLELSRLSGVHGLRPPAEMAMVGKALLNLDQVTTHLFPGFSPAKAIGRVAGIMGSGMRVSPSGIMAAAIDAKDFTRTSPARQPGHGAPRRGHLHGAGRRHRRGPLPPRHAAPREPAHHRHRARGPRRRRGADDAGADRLADPRLPLHRHGVLPACRARRRGTGRLHRGDGPPHRPRETRDRDPRT